MSFGGFLQANTQTVVIVGPFVDATDGLTPETGVTLSGADEAELLKHGSTTVVDLSAATWAAVTGCDGYYALTLTTAHLDTEGLLTVVVQDDSVCLPVKMTWQVIAQAAWASLITAKDSGFMDVNVKAVSEDTTAADNLESACDNYSATRGLAGTALPNAAADAAGGLIVSDAGGLDADALASNVAAVLEDTGTTLPGTLSTLDGKLDTIDGVADAILADTGTDGVVVAAASKTGYSLTATTGLGNQTANITGNLSGSVGSVTGNVGGNVTGSVGAVAAGGITAASIATDAIDADALAADALAEINATVDTALADYDAPTNAEMTAAFGALNDLSAAEVNAEVVDVLRTDPIPDSYAADGAQPTIAQAILAIQQYLHERSVSGTTVTVKKPDGSTAAMTFTLDDAANPTSQTRAT